MELDVWWASLEGDRSAGSGKEMRDTVFYNLTISICFENNSSEGSRTMGWIKAVALRKNPAAASC